MFTFIKITLNLVHKVYKKKGQRIMTSKVFHVQALGSFSNDKQNPGDIWMSTYGTTDYVLDKQI